MNLQDSRLLLTSRLDLLLFKFVFIPCVGSLPLDDRNISFFTNTDPLSDRGNRSTFRKGFQSKPIQTSVGQTVTIVYMTAEY